MREVVSDAFYQRFGQAPTVVVRAPGRVNLIGEHTDYNDGFVLPMAIDRAVWIALRPRPDQRVLLHSLDFEQAAGFSLDQLRHENAGWVEYCRGVAWALQEAGYSLAGWEGVMAGNVPIGAGLSSSAALELATARAFAAVSGWPWEAATMARIAQRAENQWVGMNCGIMDQMIAAAGRAGHALLIDCRSLATEAVPLPPGTVVVVLDTATRRELVESAYNERRAQCEAAARFFGAPALRDVTLAEFEALAGQLDPIIRRRARHVISENERTLQAAAAMCQGDAVTLGRLMDASHESLRQDFEVSRPELDTMAALARQQPGCYGARMTGGGFGGCAIALVETAAAPDFTTQVAAAYQAATGRQPKVYVCTATDGAEVV
ncbi:MAG: galactokinase [Chloroflexi bacterium]|nr:galactokinase [Chloroflexota bacterium]MCI0575651.1 galactokinase [Chloroflexota bacterium]MCI0644719.1 galactokinase [Chloroflexota bacterium]MCI0726692.1 galactokinase [Chloroflexota bacterium]